MGGLGCLNEVQKSEVEFKFNNFKPFKQHSTRKRSCRTMDSIRVSEAPDPGSIPGRTTKFFQPLLLVENRQILHAG